MSLYVCPFCMKEIIPGEGRQNGWPSFMYVSAKHGIAIRFGL